MRIWGDISLFVPSLYNPPAEGTFGNVFAKKQKLFFPTLFIAKKGCKKAPAYAVMKLRTSARLYKAARESETTGEKTE